MPEGDSVYRLARRLDRKLLGHTIARSELRVPRLANADLTRRQILQHATHGKHLLTRFSGGVTLHSHLLMNGEWSVTGRGKRLPPRLMPEVRVVLATVEGPTGWGLRVHQVELVRTADEDRLLGHLGPDPLHDAPPLRDHARRCPGHHRTDSEGRAALGVRTRRKAMPPVRGRDQGRCRARE